jgi:hypothetical protein
VGAGAATTAGADVGVGMGVAVGVATACSEHATVDAVADAALVASKEGMRRWSFVLAIDEKVNVLRLATASSISIIVACTPPT